MKRKLKWLAIVLAVSPLGFGTALLLWPRDRITAESWQKIRIGMTEEEVAEILGEPGMTSEEAARQFLRLENELGQPRLKAWTGRRGVMFIELDQENQVRWKHFERRRRTNGGILDRLRDWLDW